jgi:hypothetical protein
MSETKAVATVEPRPAAALEFSQVGVKINTVEEAIRVAKWSFESNLLPVQIQSAQQAFVILCKGAELGLPPFASWNHIYLTKARRLALMTKGALAVVQSKPSFESYDERIEHEDQPATEWVAVAVAKRKGKPAVIKTFSYADATAAGLTGPKTNRDGQSYAGPWQSFLKDMLLSRARGRALDIAFAAELGGIPIEGVAEDADMMEARRAGPNRTKPDLDRPSLPPPKRDPLLDELGAGLTTDRALEIQQVKNDLNSLKNDINLAAARPPEPGFVAPTLVRTIERIVVPVEIDPADVRVVEEGRTGLPPAEQAKSSPPAPVVGKRQPGKGKAGGASMPGGPLPGVAVCPRCSAKLNPMGGCDTCGWPGPDLR